MGMKKAIVTEIYSNRIMNDNVKINEFFRDSGEEAVDVDENKILEKYMDKVDQDRREQEQRTSNNIQSMEQRLSEDRKLMEQRLTEERRLSEDRMEKRFNETMESLKNTNKKIDSLEMKLDQKTDRMLDKIDATNKWIIGTCIASILAVAAIAASVWFK